MQDAQQVVHRAARVHDVLDDKNIAATDWLIQVFEDAHYSRGLSTVAVGRSGHEVNGMGYADVAHQVGQEEDASLEHGDEQQVLAPVVSADLLSQFSHARLDLFGGDKDVSYVAGRHVGSLRDDFCSEMPVIRQRWRPRGLCHQRDQGKPQAQAIPSCAASPR